MIHGSHDCLTAVIHIYIPDHHLLAARSAMTVQGFHLRRERLCEVRMALWRILSRFGSVSDHDAIGWAEASHPRAVAANHDGDVSDTTPRGQRVNPRFQRAIVERFIGRRQRIDPHRPRDQSQKKQPGSERGRNRATSDAGFWRSIDKEARSNSDARTNLTTSCAPSPLSKFGQVRSSKPFPTPASKPT
jgi:hypothetical protein